MGESKITILVYAVFGGLKGRFLLIKVRGDWSNIENPSLSHLVPHFNPEKGQKGGGGVKAPIFDIGLVLALAVLHCNFTPLNSKMNQYFASLLASIKIQRYVVLIQKIQRYSEVLFIYDHSNGNEKL